MDNDYYHSSDYKDQLNGESAEVTPNDTSVNNLSEIPAPTHTPVIYIPPINNNQNNSLCPIEKPYYETNESNQISESIQQSITQNKNCCSKCLERYDDKDILLIRIYLILTIQYIFITSIIFLIIYLEKRKSFIKGNIILQIIGVITIIASICIHFRILCMKDNRRTSKALYSYIAFYIVPIVFLYLLLQNFKLDYIIIIYITMTIDFFGLLLCILIFTFKSIKIMLAPTITSFLTIIFFYFWWNINSDIIITVLIIAFIEIIYIEIISTMCKLYFKKDNYLFAALIMDYLIFIPFAFIIYRYFINNIKVTFIREYLKKMGI